MVTERHVTDDTSFRFLYDRFAGSLIKYVLAKVDDFEVAEEIVQEVFLGLWLSMSAKPDIRNHKSWLYKTAHNKIVDYYRNKGKMQIADIDMLDNRRARNDSGSADLAAELSDVSDSRKRLSEARKRLFDLIYYFALTYEQAAEVLDIPVGTVKSQLHNIRRHFAQSVDQRDSGHKTVSRERMQPKREMSPVQYSAPGMEDVKVFNVNYRGKLTMDIYRSPDVESYASVPVVVFVMGFSNEDFIQHMGIKLKELSQYPSWGRLLAVSGFSAIAYETDAPDEDIHAVLDFILQKGKYFGLDCSRICIWACSSNVATALHPLTDRIRAYASYIKCGVLYYPVFEHFEARTENIPEALKRNLREDIPLLLVNVGKEALECKAAAAFFSEKVLSAKMPLIRIDHRAGVHGFDTCMNSAKTREIIDRTIAFMRTHLG